MKRIVQQEIKKALLSMGELSLPASLTIQVDYAREKSHGDFSSNIASAPLINIFLKINFKKLIYI